MIKRGYKYIYGPVFSWRLGSSLGIDLISSDKGKICSFDCIYCQIDKTLKISRRRRIFVPVKEVIKEVNSLPLLKIDYITFSGTGEPTLAKNLAKAIKALRTIRKEKIAVLTNSSLIHKNDVQKDLLSADFVIAKLDAASEEVFEKVNHPAGRVKVEKIAKALKEFKKKFKGKLALQVMFVKENKKDAQDIASLAREINPDEVQINTPLRPSKTKPLSRKEIFFLKKYFRGLKVRSVYDEKKSGFKPICLKKNLEKRGRF